MKFFQKKTLTLLGGIFLVIMLAGLIYVSYDASAVTENFGSNNEFTFDSDLPPGLTKETSYYWQANNSNKPESGGYIYTGDRKRTDLWFKKPTKIDGKLSLAGTKSTTTSEPSASGTTTKGTISTTTETGIKKTTVKDTEFPYPITYK